MGRNTRVSIERAARGDAGTLLGLQKAAYLSEALLYGDFTLPPSPRPWRR